MDTLKVGDRVTWQTRTTARPYLHTMTGKVIVLMEGVAAIDTGTLGPYVAYANELTKVGAIEAHVDDDYQLRHIGDLGGTELA